MEARERESGGAMLPALLLPTGSPSDGGERESFTMRMILRVMFKRHKLEVFIRPRIYINHSRSKLSPSQTQKFFKLYPGFRQTFRDWAKSMIKGMQAAGDCLPRLQFVEQEIYYVASAGSEWSVPGMRGDTAEKLARLAGTQTDLEDAVEEEYTEQVLQNDQSDVYEFAF